MKKFIIILGCFFFYSLSNAEKYVIYRAHIPSHVIVKADESKNFTITTSVLFAEIYSADNKIMYRTDPQSYGGNQVDFYFSKEIEIDNKEFPIVVKIMTGENEKVEAASRAIVGGGIGATVGAIIGGIGAGICTGGLGGPAGAVLGGTVGAMCGSAAYFMPVKDAREVCSFHFETQNTFVGTTTKKAVDDSSEDKTLFLEIKKK